MTHFNFLVEQEAKSETANNELESLNDETSEIIYGLLIF
jgi:hypothetical protein